MVLADTCLYGRRLIWDGVDVLNGDVQRGGNMLNQFQGIGNLAADPEVKYTQSGKAVASLTVCCNSGWGDKQRTEFVKCTAWDKLAEVCGSYLHKGSRVYIHGEMQTRKWQDKSGNDRYSTEIVLRDMKMLDRRDNTDERGVVERPAGMGDDVPF